MFLRRNGLREDHSDPSVPLRSGNWPPRHHCCDPTSQSSSYSLSYQSLRREEDRAGETGRCFTESLEIWFSTAALMGLYQGLMGKIKNSHRGNRYSSFNNMLEQKKNGCLPASVAWGGPCLTLSVVFYFLIIVCVPPFEKILVNE